MYAHFVPVKPVVNGICYYLLLDLLYIFYIRSPHKQCGNAVALSQKAANRAASDGQDTSFELIKT